jgi:hypothetical protein
MIKLIVIQELIATPAHALTRSTLIKKTFHHTQNMEELDTIMRSFHDANMVLTTEFNGIVMYIMPELMVNEYRKLYASRK